LVSLEERIWRDPAESYLRPFAAVAKVRARGKSRRLQRVLCDFGVELNTSAVRAATLGHAARAAGQLEAHYAQSFRVLPRSGPSHVIAETDGSMICTVAPGRRRQAPRPREWKEMRLSAARAHGSVESSYAAGFHSVEETGRRWGHCARDAGWALESRIHVVADGAEWIRLQSREVFGEQAEVLVDFYHVSEYLAAAAPICRPKAPRAWLHTQQKRLRRGAAALVFEALEPFREPASVAEEEAPVRAAWRYLDKRRACLDYPAALARELPIGSGLIESGHKHVLHARLKRPGSAWLPAHADALAQLRVLRANRQWDDFWQTRHAA